MSNPHSDAERFTAVFEAFAPRVFAYARRHTDRAAAEDVVADTFLVTWRRFADVPDDPLPWLLVIARNTLANQRRSLLRRDRLRLELNALERLASHQPAVDFAVIDRTAMLAALAGLSALEREAVLLVAWDGLSGRDAAVVAGCSERAFHVRLHRARKRLARALDTPDDSMDLTLVRLMEDAS